ncbi:sigma 54-interacting transcriptional regulator [Muricauda sp. SCSIO 64092]|uniref:sigma 54-interacting transcriptional regulator n=1 Tax=Allomuricauda sp. SCSIO 64092 TaxID=2908842 RepID=UPI001FF1EB13|nr:sigma 54-interacting transcriptional regulator [Muricauda sp. SCSIO 64092]UOY08948.1 sigma 54-interacting transcriptional regulator [Muricauda sp. SCSIO 64092]
MSEDIPFQVFREQFFKNLPYKIMWMDESGKIIYANSKFLKRLGYTRKEVEKLSIFDINPTSTQDSWQTHWQKVREEGVYSFKAVHQTKKGEFYDVEISSHFFSNNGKEIIAAIVNDISESSFYKNLLNHAERMANVGGWKLNLQDGSLVVTKQALEIFETDNKEDLLPGKVIHLFQESEELKTLLSKAIRNGASYDVVLTINGVAGHSKYVRCVTEPIVQKDKIVKIIGTYQDVTPQKEHELGLKLYKEIIDNAPDLIYIWDIHGKLLQYNEAVPKNLGYAKSELNDFYIYDLDEKITPEWWREHFMELIEKKVLNLDWLITRKDFTKFPASITANHLTYQGQNLNCAIIRDVTQKNKRDKALFEALEEIKSLKTQLEIENEYLKEEIKQEVNFDNIICQSDEYREVLEKVNQVAPTDTTVLITGESGTGKELLARAVHDNSQRKEKPLIKVNAATLPSELIESELFGHKKGAFTGATENKVGKFSLADGGTIFLDEIGELPLDLQPKLLRVIQEGEFDLLGGTKTEKVNVRIVAATNRNLEKMVKDGKFREDLFYRLNVFPIHNIPLRERKDDIPLLAQYFLKKYSARAGKSFKRLSKKTIAALMNYTFPGNIRELENLIERAVIIENGTILNPGTWIPNGGAAEFKEDLKSFEAMQRDYIIKVLEKTNWRVSGPKGAAAILDMKDKTLFAKMKRLGIEKEVRLKKS